ncbi:MAG: biopolymer transporter ExbD [Alphaproteobacteria bacterium]|nr:biopolymer transporter ExbD [Alphaproteobacteria bacterium]MDE2042288.1 biopolymer transporter ExbD [Alphaproteobacteria bacterium]MDE2341099.1 biopolymer transporter ExbD [Alphaproteobacteria bacterium]
MAMNVGKEGGEDAPMSDINTTPLVDVMLVMLIIFLITIPAAIQKLKLTLPEVSYRPTQTKPENVSLSVRQEADGTCGVYWGLSRVDFQDLAIRAATRWKADFDSIKARGEVPSDDNLPEAHIRGDASTPYKCIGGTVYAMQYGGFLRVAFISNPPHGG